MCEQIAVHLLQTRFMRDMLECLEEQSDLCDTVNENE